MAWTRRYGQVATAGVEGTGSYGYRTALGSSRKEILRCLKRALARELYPGFLDMGGIKLAVRYDATVHGAAINEWLGCLVHSPASGPP